MVDLVSHHALSIRKGEVTRKHARHGTTLVNLCQTINSVKSTEGSHRTQGMLVAFGMVLPRIAPPRNSSRAIALPRMTPTDDPAESSTPLSARINGHHTWVANAWEWVMMRGVMA